MSPASWTVCLIGRSLLTNVFSTSVIIFVICFSKKVSFTEIILKTSKWGRWKYFPSGNREIWFLSCQGIIWKETVQGHPLGKWKSTYILRCLIVCETITSRKCFPVKQNCLEILVDFINLPSEGFSILNNMGSWGRHSYTPFPCCHGLRREKETRKVRFVFFQNL